MDESAIFPQNFVAQNLVNPGEATPVSGGLVHFVYKVASEGANYYVKVRTNETQTPLPGREIKPDEMIRERNALTIMHTLSPDYFPELVADQAEQGIIMMTELLAGNVPLISALQNGDVTENGIANIGNAIGTTHRDTQGYRDDVANDDAVEFSNILNLRYGYHNFEPLNQLIATLQTRPKQVIVGGLSPKNILYRASDEAVGFCDLETTFQGAREFDIGFSLGHLLLHSQGKEAKVATFRNFTNGYSNANPTNFDDPVIITTTIGTMLYRLSNPNVPYNCGMSKVEQTQLTDALFGILEQEDISWDKLFSIFN